MNPSAAQLTAAVWSLITSLMAQKQNPVGMFKVISYLSYARYGLEGYVIAEANKLTGVYLLARCSFLKGLNYDVTQFWGCLGQLITMGVGFRLVACLCMLVMHKNKQI